MPQILFFPLKFSCSEMCTSWDDFSRLQGGWVSALGYLDSLQVKPVCRNGVRGPLAGLHLPPSETQSRQTPSTWPHRRPSLWVCHHWKVAQSPWTKSSLTWLSLPTRVPISASNNIRINRFLDHSHQNTRDSWQGEAFLCVIIQHTYWVHGEKYSQSPHLCLPCTPRSLHGILNCRLVGWIGENDLVTTRYVFK